MSDVIKNAVYRQRQTFNKSFSAGKTWHCRSIAKRIREQKLESSLIKSPSEKLINSILFGRGCRPTWLCRHCSVQWCRAVAVSQHAL